MGIIRSDTIDTPYGSSITNFYVAIADQPVEMRKEREMDPEGEMSDPVFALHFSAMAWISQDARTSGKAAVKVLSYGTTYETLPTDKTIYDLAYDYIKSTLTEGTYTDV
jgi:hypothetical protein